MVISGILTPGAEGGRPAQEGHLRPPQVRARAAAVRQGLPHEAREAHEGQKVGICSTRKMPPKSARKPAQGAI